MNERERWEVWGDPSDSPRRKPAQRASRTSGTNRNRASEWDTDSRANRGGSRGNAARPQNRNAARRRPNPPRQQKQPSELPGKILSGILMVIRGIGKGILLLFRVIGRVFSFLYHLLDPLRKTETAGIFVNSAVCAVLLIAVLCVMVALKPGNDEAAARKAAREGNVVETQRLLRSLESAGIADEMLDHTRLDVAESLIYAGEFDGAAAVLSEVSENNSTAELTTLISYEKAKRTFDSGDFNAAAQMFYQLENYEDSASRYEDCRCALAIRAYQEGEMTSVRILLASVSDLAERMERVAAEIIEDEAEVQALLSSDVLSAESLTRMEETAEGLRQAKTDLPHGRIAAGTKHTVGILADGSVHAAGDNTFGQCEVMAWTGVTQVAAGAYHTVGLRPDGTVVATGNNSVKQCEVSDWTDIVMIAAGSFDTIGLKSDGTVVAAGQHADLVNGWRNVTSIAAGSYSIACLYDKGSMMCSHGSAQLDIGAQLTDISVSGQVSVGILPDGSITSSSNLVPKWTEMISVTACETGVLGIDLSGNVKTFFYRPGDMVEISTSSPALEVESSGTHHVVLTMDGHVYAFGNNDYGQCDVSDWQM